MILSIILFVLATIFMALMELTIDKPHVFNKWPKPKNKTYWYYASVSWVYKYKNGKVISLHPLSVKHTFRPAFPGAKTWLVWLTDARHLFKMLMLVCIVLFVVFYEFKFDLLPEMKIIEISYWFLVYFVVFEITYNWAK